MQALIGFFVAHQDGLIGIAYLILNEVVRVNKNVEANSLVELVLNFLKSKFLSGAGKPPVA